MSKKTNRQAIRDNLASALEPPRKPPARRALDGLLGDYDDGLPLAGRAPVEPVALSPTPAQPAPEIERQAMPRADLPADLPISTDLPDHEIRSNSLSNSDSLSKNEPPAYQIDSLTNPNSLLKSDSLSNPDSQPQPNFLDAIKPVKGHLQLPNTIIDSLLRQLDPGEQLVYLQLFRLSWGYGKDRCSIGLPQLAERTNLSRSSVRTMVNKLVARGLVQKADYTIGYQKEQGTVYRLPISDSLLNISSLSKSNSLSNSAPIKEDLKKKVNKKQLLAAINHHSLTNIGKVYPISELAEDCKRDCARDGLEFDPALFNKLIADRSSRR